MVLFLIRSPSYRIFSGFVPRMINRVLGQPPIACDAQSSSRPCLVANLEMFCQPCTGLISRHDQALTGVDRLLPVGGTEECSFYTVEPVLLEAQNIHPSSACFPHAICKVEIQLPDVRQALEFSRCQRRLGALGSGR